MIMRVEGLFVRAIIISLCLSVFPDGAQRFPSSGTFSDECYFIFEKINASPSTCFVAEEGERLRPKRSSNYRYRTQHQTPEGYCQALATPVAVS